MEGFGWQIANGLKANIWTENWLHPPDVCPIQTTAQISNNDPQLVFEIIDWPSKTWNLDSILHLIQPSEANKILLIPIGSHDGEDRIIWPWNKRGVYTVSSRYTWINSKCRVINPPKCSSSHSVETAVWRQLWKIRAPPKVNFFFFFLWKAISGAIATFKNMFIRKLASTPLCPICGAYEESSEHMLLLCPWAEAVWFGSSLGLKINKNHISTLDSWLKEICKAHNSQDRIWVLTMVSCICWSIWKSRCSFVYDRRPISPPAVIQSSLNLALEFWSANRKDPPSLESEARSRKRWQPPPLDVVDVCCDASWIESGSCGMGVVIRSNFGELVDCVCNVNKCGSSAMAEANAQRP
ncbi:hypothetical protein ACLB2K_026384 [Fragaria x ananassa]